MDTYKPDQLSKVSIPQDGLKCCVVGLFFFQIAGEHAARCYIKCPLVTTSNARTNDRAVR
jgi:hypothetical protein